ncbi:hypothetical protein WJX84_010669 [Apatococcus fuscideae]|uniref:Hint domain-containing protein n=1 Tax=Apatococcus fuscideae TaxID=2026836 RepID=A0AAW1TEY4_9CHLO
MVSPSLQKVLACSCAVLLLACSVQAGSSRKLPYPAASNAADFQQDPTTYPVGTDLTSTPKHYVTPSACFPSGAEVQTPEGSKPIQSLRLGDKVLTVQPLGKAAFEEVFMFSHQDAKQVSTFATLTTASGKTISATPGHYLWAQKPGQEAQLTRAGDVQVGDDLFELEGSHTVSRTVVEATRITRSGLYNPHTASGSLVVDGIAATVVTDFLPASMALHTAVTLPARALYHLLPLSVAETLNSAILAGIPSIDVNSLRALVTPIKA